MNKIVLVLGSAFLFISCKKYVSVPAPATQLVTSTTFSDASAATAAMMYVYTDMMSNSESANLEIDNGLLSDELVSAVPGTNLYPFYTNNLTALQSPGPWSHGYNYIYQANAIIEGLQQYKKISPAISSELVGEAEFIRAFWYFILANCYGNIPLATTTNFYVNSVLPRVDKSVIYGQIINDLLDAKARLSLNYLDATDTTVTVERVRPTKWAAMALLARVYLYIGNNSAAFNESDSVINQGTLFSLTPLSDVFLANSNEAIWQLMIPQPTRTYATPDGNKFILTGAPGSNPILSTFLLNSFENGDERSQTWIGSFTKSGSPATTYYYPYKYKVKTGQTISEYEMVLRLGEQFLIRAEAAARLGELGMAISDLNIIRARAGLSGTSATTATEVIAAILHERQVEMFTEWGSRWFDLIRTGEIGLVMDSIASVKNAQWSLNDTLYPIPQSELNADPNLNQNIGYN